MNRASYRSWSNDLNSFYHVALVVVIVLHQAASGYGISTGTSSHAGIILYS
jgi:hypothetical protein